MLIEMNLKDQKWIQDNDQDLWKRLNGVAVDGASERTMTRYAWLMAGKTVGDILCVEDMASKMAAVDRKKHAHDRFIKGLRG